MGKLEEIQEHDRLQQAEFVRAVDEGEDPEVALLRIRRATWPLYSKILSMQEPTILPFPSPDESPPRKPAA